MKRTKLEDRRLPNYSKNEERFNMISHIVGGALGIVATVLCVVTAARKGNPYSVVGGAIFGAMMMALYAVSSVYHGLHPHLRAKKVMQVIDHCTIFLLIAGTYTPVTLCSVRELSPALGWTMFGVIWGMALMGIVFNAIDLRKFRVFSMVCYLAMGWCIVLTANKMPAMLGKGGVALLVSGGVSYTIGAVLYILGAKRPYMHAVFHVFVVIGSLLHFLCILLYVL